jgi:hypothetical protein
MAYLPAGISMEELLVAAEDLQQMLPTPMPSRPGMGYRRCCCCDCMVLLPPSLPLLLLLRLHALSAYVHGAPALAPALALLLPFSLLPFSPHPPLVQSRLLQRMRAGSTRLWIWLCSWLRMPSG